MTSGGLTSPLLGKKDDIELNARGGSSSSSCFQETKRWSLGTWAGRVVSPILGGGSIASTALKAAGAIANGLSALSVGFFAQITAQSIVPRKHLQNLRRFSLVVAGQGTIFALTSGAVNTAKAAKDGFVASIISCLGVSGAVRLDKLYKNRFVITANAGEEETRSKNNLSHIFLNRERISFLPRWAPPLNKMDLLRFAIASGLAVGAYFNEDEDLRHTCAGLSAHVFTQIVGEKIGTYIENRIEEEKKQPLNSTKDGNDFEEDEEFKLPVASNWQKVQTGVLTASSLATLGILPIVSIAPDLKSSTLGWNIGGGAVSGFSDALSDASSMKRAMELDIKSFTELSEYEPGPGLAGTAFKVSFISYPILYNLFVLGFSTWQIGWDLDDAASKWALGLMALGSMGTYALCTVIDRAWKQKTRAEIENPNWKTKTKDWLIYYTAVSDSSVMSPFTFSYFVISNTKLNDRILPTYGPLKRGVAFAAWLFYGVTSQLCVFRNGTMKKWGIPNNWKVDFGETNAAVTFFRKVLKLPL